VEKGRAASPSSSPGCTRAGHSRVIIVSDSQLGHLKRAPVTAEPASAPRLTRVRNAPQLILTPLMASKFALAWVRI